MPCQSDLFYRAYLVTICKRGATAVYCLYCIYKSLRKGYWSIGHKKLFKKHSSLNERLCCHYPLMWNNILFAKTGKIHNLRQTKDVNHERKGFIHKLSWQQGGGGFTKCQGYQIKIIDFVMLSCQQEGEGGFNIVQKSVNIVCERPLNMLCQNLFQFLEQITY